MATARYGPGLLVSLRSEGRRTYVRHPDLDGPHAAGAKPCTMPADPLGDRETGVATDHGVMLHATAPTTTTETEIRAAARLPTWSGDRSWND
jgi:hypothetical protein